MENNPTNVVAAFEFLLEEIEVEIAFLQEVGTKAMGKRDYKSTHEAIKRASQVTVFQEKVASLCNEWETLAVLPSRIVVKDLFSVTQHNQECLQQSEIVTKDLFSVRRRNLGHLKHGIRTPETAYYRPILIALTELGGSARINEVLRKVEQFMKKELKSVDYEPLHSSGKPPRWYNTAQWARNTLVEDGLLKSTSPHGRWEITENGRMFLTKGTHSLLMNTSPNSNADVNPPPARM